jgi:ribosomal protein S13
MPVVIAKTILPDTAKFCIALGRIFGIGRQNGLTISEEVGISSEVRVADVKAHQVRQVIALINERYKVRTTASTCS